MGPVRFGLFTTGGGVRLWMSATCGVFFFLVGGRGLGRFLALAMRLFLGLGRGLGRFLTLATMRGRGCGLGCFLILVAMRGRGRGRALATRRFRGLGMRLRGFRMRFRRAIRRMRGGRRTRRTIFLVRLVTMSWVRLAGRFLYL